MERKILDYKAISSSDTLTLANFVHQMTLKGYEPLGMQCTKQFGNHVITMALCDGEINESNEESTGSKPDIETTNTVGSSTGEGEAEEQGSKEADGNGVEHTGVTDKSSDIASEPDTKPKRNTRAKAKVA